MKGKTHLMNGLIVKQYFGGRRGEVTEIKDFCDRYHTDRKGTDCNCLKWNDLDVQFARSGSGSLNGKR